MSKRYFDCVVVGAGPAGLSVAYYLKRMGVNFVLIDEHGIGASWENMNDTLRLVSPWWTNVLPGTIPNPLHAFEKHSRLSFVRYLQSYYKKNDLGPVLQERVCEVHSCSDGYSIETAEGGLIQAKSVVCASGYFGNPYFPEIESDDSVEIVHASSYKNVKQLLARGVAKVLVVGRRVTAGQLAEELYSAGISVTLSARGQVEVKRNDSFMGGLREQVYFFWESLKLYFQPEVKANSYAIMDGGKIREYIHSGSIPVLGKPQKIEAGMVYLEGRDAPLAVDQIWLATGYKPNLGYLKSFNLSFEDSSMPVIVQQLHDAYPGVHLVGFDNLFNFTSRYLRGIRRDSKRIAKQIEAHLKPG
ncbi:NAD(P)/FAD-dependent oxidoreductase [Pseudoteredinibacter isoporae]|uniref:NAD(P)/FAD-dependent oxidoreductase n=1 Tax=Pseudoteredinibacter isoporae TaxID=570281 RepID=UPI00310A3C18